VHQVGNQPGLLLFMSGSTDRRFSYLRWMSLSTSLSLRPQIANDIAKLPVRWAVVTLNCAYLKLIRQSKIFFFIPCVWGLPQPLWLNDVGHWPSVGTPHLWQSWQCSYFFRTRSLIAFHHNTENLFKCDSLIRLQHGYEAVSENKFTLHIIWGTCVQV